MVLNQTGLPASTNPERGCTPPIGSPPAENTTTEGSSTRPRASIRSFSFFSFSRISVELRQSMCVCVDAFFYQGSVDVFEHQRLTVILTEQLYVSDISIQQEPMN